jgi:parvulin-like peptidyl-prolyl isomerase
MRRLLLLLIIANSVHAEVYKCQLSAKNIVYQSVPCSGGSTNKNIVNIEELTPQQKEEAEKRLKATQEERQALDKTAQEQQEKAAAQRREEATQREITATRQAAEAASQAAATAARQQTTIPYNPYPTIISPPYSGYGYGYMPNYQHHYPQHPNYQPNVPSYNTTPNPSFSPYPSFSPQPYPSFSPYPNVVPYPTQPLPPNVAPLSPSR